VKAWSLSSKEDNVAELHDWERVGLYLFLMEREEELDDTLFSLYNRLQRGLNEELSIEEMETLRRLYDGKVDIFKRKG
jgi:hypothetical protein